MRQHNTLGQLNRLFRVKFFGAVLLLLSLNFSYSFAQNKAEVIEADTLYRIVMNDGNIFIGEIVDINKEKVILKSESLNQITLHRRYIVSIELIRSNDPTRGDLWYRNVQSARYFFAPNGFGLKKGEAYYQNIWVFYNQYTYAFSDNFSIGIGTMPFFLLGFSPTPIWITPKFSMPLVKDKISLGVGALIGDVIGDAGGLFGITYATTTFGSPDKNVSVGLGFLFLDGNVVSTPLINFGGLLRVSRKTYLMTENYVFTDGNSVGAFTIIGARSMINKSAIDYGLGMPIVPGSGFIALPWLGLTVPFKKK